MTQIPALNFATGGYCPELDSSYLPGQYQAKDAEEYKALAPYAVDAPELELDDADKAGLQVSVDAVKELLDACKGLDPSLA